MSPNLKIRERSIYYGRHLETTLETTMHWDKSIAMGLYYKTTHVHNLFQPLWSPLRDLQALHSNIRYGWKGLLVSNIRSLLYDNNYKSIIDIYFYESFPTPNLK